jgi:SAM-dependent methyltransferase
VDAVDLSPAALAWARERAQIAGADVRFHCGDIFQLPLGRYDLVYDSGCLNEIEIRRMNEQSPDSPAFGEPFLLTALFQRPADH